MDYGSTCVMGRLVGWLVVRVRCGVMWFCDGRCCFVRTSRSVSLSPVTSRNRGDVGHSRFSVGSCLVSLQVLSMSFLVLWCRGWYGILNVSFLLVVVVVSLVLFVSSVCLGMRSALLVCC